MPEASYFKPEGEPRRPKKAHFLLECILWAERKLEELIPDWKVLSQAQEGQFYAQAGYLGSVIDQLGSGRPLIPLSEPEGI